MKRLGALFVLLFPLGASSATAQTFTEFPVPTAGAYPNAIAAGPDGNLWFTENAVGSPGIGRITPEGVIAEFRIPNAAPEPMGITAGPDGNLWFTEGAFCGGNDCLGHIGRVTTSGSFTEFPVPQIYGGVVPYGITTGPDGALWFTENTWDTIARITTSGAITEFLIPAEHIHVQGIVAGPDGALWFTEQNANKIGRITTSGAITEFQIPKPDSHCRGHECGPHSIAAGPDGALWFTEPNTIGRITTSGEITEFPIPTPESEPWGIVAGLDGSLYFTEFAGNKIGRITTSGVITEFPIPTPLSSPQGIALGPDGAIWFTESRANKIGRLSIGPLTCESNPTTMCLNGGRFRVTADWRTAEGAIGQGQAMPLTADTGYFWFFNPENIEIVIKVLNACVDPFNAYWVFSAGLTNVEVTIRVVDTQKGSVKTYFNPLNTPYQPVQDTSAFATCP